MEGQYHTQFSPGLPAAGTFLPYANPASSNEIFSFTGHQEEYLQNPYGTMVRPVLNVNALQAELNPKLPYGMPQTISIPAENLRVISSQVRPMQQPETYVPIPLNQKYTTQISARIKYLGAPLRNDMMKPLPPVQLADTTIISAGPSQPMPIVAASAAMRESPKEIRFLTVCPGSVLTNLLLPRSSGFQFMFLKLMASYFSDHGLCAAGNEGFG